MKAEIRELLTDFKAAVRLGHPDSLALALDGLRALPEVSGNEAFGEAFLDNVVLPLGETLTHPQVDDNLLLAWLDEPLTGVRAVSAAALASRWAARGSAAEALRRAGGDSRGEVRLALAKALAHASRERPGVATRFVTGWLSDQSPRLRQTALLALAGLAEAPAVDRAWAEEVSGSLAPLSGEADPDVRAALVAALVSLAEAGYPKPVLALLEGWTSQETDSSWVIARTLSASWAANHPARAHAILDRLAARAATSRHVESARRALSRHQAR